MNNLKSWWASLESREQRLVSVAGLTILLAVFYWGLWSPLNASLDEQKVKLKKQQQLLSWMKEKGPTIIASKSSTKVSGSNQSLTQIINATANRKKIKLSRVQPKGTTEIQIWIDDVKFSTLLTWLEMLEKRYGILVSNTELARADKIGFATVRRLQLERK